MYQLTMDSTISTSFDRAPSLMGRALEMSFGRVAQ